MDALDALSENLRKQLALPQGEERDALIEEMYSYFGPAADELKQVRPAVHPRLTTPLMEFRI